MNITDKHKCHLLKENLVLLHGKVDKLLNVYPEVKTVLPDDISAQKLLVGNFKYLTLMY